MDSRRFEKKNSKKKNFIEKKKAAALFHHRERQKHKHTRGTKRGEVQSTSHARINEREKEREMNQMLKNDDVSCLPALASFCATNNPSNGLFRCHWRTLARFSIASSAASSNRKRQYACGLIDCSIMLWSNLNLSSFALFSLRSSDSLFFLSSFFRESFFSLSEVCHQFFFSLLF